MKTHTVFLAMALLPPLALPPTAHGQIVADGSTRILNGVTTNIFSDVVVGTNGAFTRLILTNGSIVNTGPQSNNFRAYIGRNTSARSNLVVVTGTGSLWTNSNSFFVGYSGGFNQLVVSGSGALTAPDFHIGYSGSFNQMLVTNGGVVGTGAGMMADLSSSSNNVAVVAGVGSLWTNSGCYVGTSGSFNQLIVTNGGRVVGGYAALAQFSDSSNNLAVVAGVGSVWTATPQIAIGSAGSFNQLIVTNGGVVSDVDGTLGASSGSRNNTAVVTGVGSLWTNRSFLFVGSWGSSNQLLIANGGRAACSAAIIGSAFGSSHNLAIVSGPGSVWAIGSYLNIASSGSNNRLVVSNAGTVVAQSLYLGQSAGFSNNAVTVAGGILIITNLYADGPISVQNGTLTLNSGRVLTDYLYADRGPQSQVIFNGGLLQTRLTSQSNGLPFIVGNGTSTATLELLGNRTHTFAGGLQIARNAVLKGSGTVTANVTNLSGGTLSPGASIGALVIKGHLTLAAGSTSVFELDKGHATNDVISGLANLTLGGTLMLTNLSGTLTNGDSFTLFGATNYAGAFSAVVAASPGPGLQWDTSRLAVDGVLRVVPGPTAPPVLGGVRLLRGTNLVFSASGGVPYAPVYVLTSTNLALPMSNWASWATNYFDASGKVSITNRITSGEPKRFLRLRVD